MTQPWEATYVSSNNPYRTSMTSHQTTSKTPQTNPYLTTKDPFQDDYEQESPPPTYQPYGSSVAFTPSRTTSSMAPLQHRMSIIPERRHGSGHLGVPSLDVTEQSWGDNREVPGTPDDVSDDGYAVTYSREVPPGGGSVTPVTVTPKRDVWGVPEAPLYTSKRVLRKIRRLVRTHPKEVETITVFNSDDDIICTHEATGAPQENRRYIPTPDEGRYIRLALELGFRSEGCGFAFGGVAWLSGHQDEVDEKRTLMGSAANDPQSGNHQFYGVLSPTGRYVFAAILKETTTPSGAVPSPSPRVMRRVRDLADKMEVYEARAGGGGVMAKIEAVLNR